MNQREQDYAVTKAYFIFFPGKCFNFSFFLLIYHIQHGDFQDISLVLCSSTAFSSV